MLLKKLSTIGVAVVATLSLATSAAVLARQATSAGRGDQTNRQIVRGSVGGEPSDASRSAAPVQRAPKEDEEEPTGSSSSASTSKGSRPNFKL
jgi:hypothetical protein